MIKTMRTKFGGAAVLFAVVATLALGLAGCSSSDSDDSTGPDTPAVSAFVGTWQLHEGSAAAGAVAWYVHFKQDKTFFISDFADGTRVRVSGTWSEANGLLTGPFTNPRVGEGRVECRIANNVLIMDFIEYWHTPNKHVPYAGTKI